MEIAKVNKEIAPQDRADEILNKFIGSLDVKENSRQLYSRTLKQFFLWLVIKHYSLVEVTREHIIEYKEELLSSGKSSLTAASYLNSVKLFFEYAEACKYYPNVAKGVRAPKRKQQFRKQPLLPAQATDLLNYYQSKALRDYAIISLLLRTGLRTIEIVRAKVGDIVYKGSQRVLLIQGKGRDEKDNFVLLTNKSAEPILAYLQTREGALDSEPLFVSSSNNSQGEALTTRSISKIAKEGLKAIGLNEKYFTAHSLRHTTAVNILRGGGSLEQAQMTLRHSNPATTQIYTATLNEERRLKDSGEALIDTLY